MLKKERGITLIALIVTIIVIIIVAGITISAITGNKGIVNQAEISKNKSERQEIIENANKCCYGKCRNRLNKKPIKRNIR